eukprot:scaffold484411_cov17-Prasinocladus_malaysianus.AAC.1
MFPVKPLSRIERQMQGGLPYLLFRIWQPKNASALWMCGRYWVGLHPACKSFPCRAIISFHLDGRDTSQAAAAGEKLMQSDLQATILSLGR